MKRMLLAELYAAVPMPSYRAMSMVPEIVGWIR